MADFETHPVGTAEHLAELGNPKKKRRDNPKQFFIVFSPEGAAPPKIVHGTHKGALYAAVQMAKYNPEASFFVMGSMSGRIIPRDEAEAVKEPAEQVRA